MFISLSFSKCDIKTGMKKVTLEEKHTSHFEQTLNLLKCEEKVITCMISVLGRQTAYKQVSS